MHPCRDFAQLSILPLFSSASVANSDSRRGGTAVSLVDFLDKRLGKFNATRQECEKSKESKVSRSSLFHQSEHSEEEPPAQKPFTNNNRVIDHLLSRRVSKKRDLETGDDYGNESTKMGVSNVDSQSCQRVDGQPGAKRNPKSSIQSGKRRKRRRLAQGSWDEVPLTRNSSRHMLVVGDDPITRSNFGQRRFQETVHANFNHYVDGGGWWDEDMVGVDQALGSMDEWEGVGTTSLGTSLGPTL